jgi:serine/threonine protein kinase
VSANESHLETLLIAAVEISDESQRDIFLEEACSGDSALLAEMQSMVHDYFAAGTLIDRPADAIAPLIVPLTRSEAPGCQIGPYKLREVLGEGGMGTVFVAEQERPVRRKVALKLIKLGMDSCDVISRFEAERQALALMDHPNIARVLDAGMTDGGRPYFVMEMVRGLSITEHCDRHKLSSRERLELFLQVCRAIQHAHQKGIIHRDLKPSNVLVAMHDTIPVVKVIDFGVAKAIAQPLTEKSLYTGLGQMVGTPLYMSPEQAGQSSLDVDTRSDVYSLGVLLYELLTGCTPFEKDTLRKVGFDELRRMIQEVDPPRPSTRFSTLNAAASATIASCRQSEPHKLSQQLRGELDWIVMKALEKDRTRRYESASAFAADVERYLNDAPVEACPPSFSYRIRKMIRRHWSILLTTVAVTIALVSGTAISLWQALEAQDAREQAIHDKILAEAAGREAKADRDRAQEAARKAEEEAATVAAVNDFLLKDMIGLADSNMQSIAGITPSPQLTLREALDSSSATVGERFANQPRVEARLRTTIGIAYRGLGEPQKSISHLERAVSLSRTEFGPDHADTIDAISALANTLRTVGRSRDAIPMLEAIGNHLEARLGADHVRSLITQQNLAEAIFDSSREAEGLKLMQELLVRFSAVLGPDAEETLTCESNLAVALIKVRQPQDAIPLLERVIAKQIRLGLDAPDTLGAKCDLAVAYGDTGRVDDAIKLQEELRKSLSAAFGEDHPKTLTNMNNLASNYGEVGRTEDAIALHQETLDQCLARLGPDHIDTLVGLNNLAVDYMRAKRPADALPLYEQSYNGRTKLLGMGHRGTLDCLNNLSVAYQNLRRTEDALRLLRDAFEQVKAEFGATHRHARQILQWQVDICERTCQFTELAAIRRQILDDCLCHLDPGHPDRLIELDRLAQACDQAGDFDTAATVMNQYLDEQQANIRPNEPNSLAALRKLGDYYRRAGKWTAAETVYKDLRDRASATLGPDDRSTLNFESGRAQILSLSGRVSEAIVLLEHVGDKQEAIFGPFDSQRLGTLNSLASAYYFDGRLADSERVASDLLTRQKQANETEPIGIAQTLSLLGMSFVAHGKFAEAENVLRESLTIWDTVKKPAWQRFRAMNLLGAAIGGQSRPLEAEPLLVDGYDGMLADKQLIPVPWKRHLDAAGEHVLRFYESQGDSEKADFWRNKLAAASSPNK